LLLGVPGVVLPFVPSAAPGPRHVSFLGMDRLWQGMLLAALGGAVVAALAFARGNRALRPALAAVLVCAIGLGDLYLDTSVDWPYTL